MQAFSCSVGSMFYGVWLYLLLNAVETRVSFSDELSDFRLVLELLGIFTLKISHKTSWVGGGGGVDSSIFQWFIEKYFDLEPRVR